MTRNKFATCCHCPYHDFLVCVEHVRITFLIARVPILQFNVHKKFDVNILIFLDGKHLSFPGSNFYFSAAPAQQVFCADDTFIVLDGKQNLYNASGQVIATQVSHASCGMYHFAYICMLLF